MRETILTDDSVIVVETSTEVCQRHVSWNDIEVRVEYDCDHYETPWDACDGLEHEFVKDHWEDHDDKCNAYSRVSRSLRDGGPGYIVIDDSTVINRWGFTRRAGESKQVWLERVAAEKRRTAERIVEWYENGWEWFGAVAEYGDYLESVWGIDDEKYALETAETEMRGQVADRMEQDGYIITDQPEPQPGYSPVDAMRHRIRHQLAG